VERAFPKGKWCKVNCQEKSCLLYSSIEVPYKGNPKGSVVFIGESPGREEIQQGIPFVGDTGKLLDKVTLKEGIDLSKILYLNSARCTIDKSKYGVKDITSILNCCRPKIVSIIKKVKPRLIVVMGDIALRQILKKSGITKHRKSFVYAEEFGCFVRPIFHPAYILRNMALLPRFTQDIRDIRNFINNGFKEVAFNEKLTYIIDPLNLSAIFASLENKAISIDTETQGLNWAGSNFLTLSFSICSSKGQAYQFNLYKEVPVQDSDFTIKWERKEKGTKKSITEVGIKREYGFWYILKMLRQVLEDVNIKKYMMTTFDLHAFDALFQREHMPPLKIRNFVLELQAVASLLDENLYSMTSLDVLQKDFTSISCDYNTEFGQQYDKSDMLIAKFSAKTAFDTYACYDADVTYRAGVAIKNIFKKKKNQSILRYFVNFTMPIMKNVLYKMTKNGIGFDLTKFSEVKKYVKGILDTSEQEVLDLTPETIKERHKEKGISLSRSDFMRDLLYSKEGCALVPLKNNKTGPSIDKVTRSLFLDSDRLPEYARNLLDKYNIYRDISTIYTRNLNKYKRYINHGRIHTRLNITKAKTGRVSSSDPNLMNMPQRSKLSPKIRSLMIARDGYTLVATDESQSELRIMAHVANDKNMLEVFRSGGDIHTNTAKELAGYRWQSFSEEEKKKYRKYAKAINFGLLYGMSDNGFMKYAKLEYDLTLSFKEAREWVSLFFDLYYGIKKYHSDIVSFCKRQGYVESFLGRRRRLPEINSRDLFRRGEAERQAINHPIQSPSSDMVLIACDDIEGNQYPEEEIRPLLFIHDELIYEVKDELINKYIPHIKYAMEHPSLYERFGVKLNVPLVAGIKVGKNLGELREINVY